MFFVYGFGPYDEFDDNITAKIIPQLALDPDDHFRIFDVVFDRTVIEEALKIAAPKFILGLGQTREGAKLRIEQRILNAMAERTLQPVTISADAGESTRDIRWKLPVAEFCEESDNPGTYVCNFSMWIAEEWALSYGAQFAFVHVPRLFDPSVAADYVRSIIKSARSGEQMGESQGNFSTFKLTLPSICRHRVKEVKRCLEDLSDGEERTEAASKVHEGIQA